MKEFALITDSSCALTKDLRERFGIDGVMLGNVEYPDGHSEKADLDWERMTPEQYFGSMASKKFIYKTSCCNIDEAYETMKPFAEKGQDLLIITISHALSGTYNVALQAAKRIEEEFPEVHARVIDSLRYSTALGMLLVEANKLREEGKSMEEVADWVEEHKSRFHQMGFMDDMFFLARTGRVSKAKAFMGTLVGVEPMAEIDATGLSTVIGKAKGKKKAIMATVEYTKQMIEEPEKHILFVCHSARPKEAELLRSELVKVFPTTEIVFNSVDQSSGANIGPGLVVCFFYGKPASTNLETEKEVLGKILA